MKDVGLALLGWIVPGGGYLLMRRRAYFAAWFLLVCGTFSLGLAMGGGGLWLTSAELSGLDGLGSVMAVGGVLSKMLAGGPYLLAWVAGHLPGYLEGRLHEYGTTLLVFAGVLNLMSIVSVRKK